MNTSLSHIVPETDPLYKESPMLSKHETEKRVSLALDKFDYVLSGTTQFNDKVDQYSFKNAKTHSIAVAINNITAIDHQKMLQGIHKIIQAKTGKDCIGLIEGQSAFNSQINNFIAYLSESTSKESSSTLFALILCS